MAVNEPTALRDYVYEAVDTIDSAVYTGDTLTTMQAIDEIEGYLVKWLKEVQLARENVMAFENE